MTLTPEDRLAIHELIARYGHIVDEREFSRVLEIFIPEAHYDVSSFGAGVHVGVDAVVALWAAPGTRHPLAHHATNVVIHHESGGAVRVVSKGLGVLSGGGVGSVTYHDEVVNTSAGWRIAKRVALKRDRHSIPEPS